MTAQEPAYRRVLAELRAQILSGQLAAGAKLPSVRTIGRTFAVPASTVTRAIDELRAEGRVISRQGAGVYVRQFQPIPRSSPSRLARDQWGTGKAIQDADTNQRRRTVDVEVGEAPAPDWVAEPLGLPTDTQVVFRSRSFVVEDRYVQLATSYLPTDLARGTAIMHTDTGDGGIYARLKDTGHEPVTFYEELRCRMPHPLESQKLHLPNGTPVIEITRHAFQTDGRCVEVNRMTLDATAYVLDYTFTADIPPPSRSRKPRTTQR